MSQLTPEQSPREGAKTVALVLSTMRSGSTLLKALLSVPDDVASLPETDFQKFQSADASQRISALAPEPIILLKRPAWFNEGKRYPKLPRDTETKRIILVRDVHPNVLSLRKMVFRKLEPYAPAIVDSWMAVSYWSRVYNSLWERFPESDPANYWLRYEELVADPIRHTKALFSFLGSQQRDGIDAYDKPSSYEWKWGTDDGGAKIKSLTVQASPVPAKALEILERVRRIPEVQATRERLGYG